MKAGIHPENYRLVAVKDMSNGDTFITRSCADSKETIKIDGVDYPLIKREIKLSTRNFGLILSYSSFFVLSLLIFNAI